MDQSQPSLKRINKFISESGFCSRREADKLIEQQRVTINGKLPEIGTKVSATDEVRVDGKLIEIQPEFIYPILAEIIFQSVHFIVRVVHLAQPTLKLLGSTPVFNKFLINIIL